MQDHFQHVEKNMKVAMTLLVRDEIDIIRQWMDHHLPHASVLAITDNGSVDGTREILGAYKEQHPDRIILIDEPKHDFQQNVWVDKMIRACLERGPDWIMNSDADEFWYIPFTELQNTPGNIGGLAVRHRNVVPTIKDDFTEPDPLKRMQWWIAKGRTPWEQSCMSGWNKVIHRAQGWKANVLGNHRVEMDPKYKIIGAPREWRIDHYSNRSWQQFRRKYINGGEAYSLSKWTKDYGFHWRERYELYMNGGVIRLKKKWFDELEKDMSKVVSMDRTDV